MNEEDVKDRIIDRHRAIFIQAIDLSKSKYDYRFSPFKIEGQYVDDSLAVKINKLRCWPLWPTVLEEVWADTTLLFENTGCLFLLGNEVYLASTNFTVDDWDILNVFVTMGLYPPLDLVGTVESKPPYVRLGYERVGIIAKYVRRSIQTHKKKYKKLIKRTQNIQFNLEFAHLKNADLKIFGTKLNTYLFPRREKP